MKPRLLDLFCGAGGAAMGYHRAGFEVVGVDINSQPHYPFEFHQADALMFPLDGFDAVHASPPCQHETAMKTMWNAKDHSDLLSPILERLKALSVPWVIENVPSPTSPMNLWVQLCGSAFGLGTTEPKRQLRRHRWFQCSVSMLVPSCQHAGRTIGIYGDHARDRKRNEGSSDRGIDFPDKDRIRLAQEALGIDWISTWKPLSQAIPPAYTHFIGEQLLQHLG